MKRGSRRKGRKTPRAPQNIGGRRRLRSMLARSWEKQPKARAARRRRKIQRLQQRASRAANR